MKDYLDGFRGLAVALLVLGHYSIYFPSGQDDFSPIAKMGVILFFILSSFLLTKGMIEKKVINIKTLIQYAIRRLLRIYPIYILALLLLTFIPQFSKAMYAGENWSLLDHILLIEPKGNYWAIAVEFKYYLIIPIIGIVYVKLNRLYKGILAIFLLLIGISSYIYK